MKRMSCVPEKLVCQNGEGMKRKTKWTADGQAEKNGLKTTHGWSLRKVQGWNVSCLLRKDLSIFSRYSIFLAI